VDTSGRANTRRNFAGIRKAGRLVMALTAYTYAGTYGASTRHAKEIKHGS
jgi:hypothetical protein